MRWLIALLLTGLATLAMAEDKAIPTEAQRAVVSHSEWLNTSRPLTAEDLQGRIVLLDFWTLGCINCMDIIPDLKALEQEFGNNLTVIGVHSAKFANEKDTVNIRNAVLRYGLTHPVVNDADFGIWNAFGVRAWPTLVLMDPQGKVTNVYSGEGNKAAIEADVKGLIAGSKDSLVTTPLPLAPESGKVPKTALSFPGKVIVADKWGPGKKTYPALYIADSGHNRIVVADLQGHMEQVIGSGVPGLKDGSFAEAQFFKPQGLAYKDGLLYVADLGNHALRVIDGARGTVTTLAGNGTQGHFIGEGEMDAHKAVLSSPWDVTFFPDDNHLAIAMAGAHQIWSYDISRQIISLLAGNGQESIDDGHYPFNSLSQPSGLFAANGNLYFTDAESSSLRVFDKDNNITTLIGKGLFDFGYKEGGKEEALLQHCLGLTGDGQNLYIADTYNHSIRRYDLKESKLHNYAGHNERGATDGALIAASFNEPGGIAYSGGTLYVADTNNHLLRSIDMKAGTVSALGEKASPTPVATVQPATAPVAPPAPAAAPNLAKLAFTVAADKPVEVDLELKAGWHINDTAPSELSLMNGDTPLLGFSREMIKQRHITLPKLKAGGNYRLNGTLYYCEEKGGSLCMIKSFDVSLAPKGKDVKITLPVY